MKTPQKILTGGIVIIAAACAAIYANRSPSLATTQATDDAYVKADMTTIASRIAGTIASVNVKDYDQVNAGDLLFTIDDRDLKIALQHAQAATENAAAIVEELTAELNAHGNSIRQAEATLQLDKANLELAKTNQIRFENLAKDGSGTVQDQQQADAELQVQEATHQRDSEALLAARQQTAVIEAQLKSAQANLNAAKATESQAELNLSYAKITAPSAGIVAQRLPRVGSYVQIGQAQITLVPTQGLYVEANFRETQLVNIHPGQKVDIRVDALPGAKLAGIVDQVGPASGVSFSEVSPHNATGNFTKIVQRLPVRIRVNSGQPESSMLRVGMSVQPKIHTD